MRDYEYLFVTTLHEKLKEVIFAKIYCKVNESDQLYVEISNNGVGVFRWTTDNFSEKLIYGYSVNTVANEVVAKYKRFILNYYFK